MGGGCTYQTYVSDIICPDNIMKKILIKQGGILEN